MKCEIDLGLVDFDRFIVTTNTTDEEQKEEIVIHRTDNKERNRPNAEKRHN